VINVQKKLLELLFELISASFSMLLLVISMAIVFALISIYFDSAQPFFDQFTRFLLLLLNNSWMNLIFNSDGSTFITTNLSIFMSLFCLLLGECLILKWIAGKAIAKCYECSTSTISLLISLPITEETSSEEV